MDDLTAFGELVLGGKLDARVALECFLLVRLGLRRAAVVSVPAELPDGEVLGAQVDFEFRDRVAGQGRDMRARLSDMIERRRLDPVAFKTHVLRSSFENNVLNAESYRSHLAAARALGLEVLQSEVRPTIREWFVTLPANRQEVADLLRRRHEVQKKARPEFRAGGLIDYYVYPEERDADYVRTLGRLLGYPECCVEEYVRGRLEGNGLSEATPERRTARQLTESEAAGPGGQAEPAAYWLKDFFPCRPDCPAAVGRGREAAAALATVDPRLAELYAGLQLRNRERVKAGPAAIRQHTEWLNRR